MTTICIAWHGIWTVALAATLLTAAPAPAAGEGAARLTGVRWLDPGEDHVVEPYGMITAKVAGTLVTKLPPPEKVGALSMPFEMTFDTSKGRKASVRFKSRSGMLDIQPPAELEGDEIAESAVDGDTATVRAVVTVDPLKLKRLQPVYYEVVSVTARPKAAQGLAWTFKPFGKHDDGKERLPPTPPAAPGPPSP
jgi:hypothetical protein